MTCASTAHARQRFGMPFAKIALIISAASLFSAPLFAAETVVVPTHDFAESITATSDGTLIFSSFTGGRISRAAANAKEAGEWIKPGTNGLLSVLGVLADEASNTLYACSVDASGIGVVVPTGTKPGALKTFDLKTGAPKASYDMPAGTIAGQMPLCNDMVVAADGTVYVTDSLSGRILRLKKGATALESGRPIRVGTSRARSSTASRCSTTAISIPTFSKATGFIVSRSSPTAAPAQSPSSKPHASFIIPTAFAASARILF